MKDVSEHSISEKHNTFGKKRMVKVLLFTLVIILAWIIQLFVTICGIFWYDLNADGTVNKLDFTILLNNLITNIKTPESYSLGDINTDGVIDFNDVEILLSRKNSQADWYTTEEPTPK